jgi:parallel beta-helix repeat protein
MDKLAVKHLHYCAICVGILFSMMFSQGPAHAATFCVSTAAELTSALTTVESNGADDVIQIVQGTYQGNFVYASNEAQHLTIEGGYTASCASRNVDPSNTVLDGEATATVLDLSSNPAADFVIDGLTLQNGSTNSDGGGLFVSVNGDLTLTNSTIRNNSAYDYYSDGGGVYVVASTATLTNNTIHDNTANDDGGGIYVDASTLTLTNNTIRSNSANDHGGGMYVDAPTVTLHNNTIGSNSANDDGGGMFVDASTVTLTENIISSNSTNDDGGGMLIYYPSSMTLTNNTIRTNFANGSESNGGGVFAYAATTVILTNNTISGNFGDDGGGIYTYHASTVSLSSNTISANFANDDGGGVFDDCSTTVTLTNNVISSNTANDKGGGILAGCGGSTVTFTNNTISGNTANDSGGGVWLYLYYDSDNTNIYNNIIWGNIGAQGADLYVDNDGNSNSTPSRVNLYNNDFDLRTMFIHVPFSIDPSNLDQNPFVVDSAQEDYHLQECSPAINRGRNDAPAIPMTDKDGNARIGDGVVDMGAFEFSGPVIGLPCINDISPTSTHIGSLVTLTGKTFGDTQGSGTVTFDSTVAQVSSWGDTHIEVKVPLLPPGLYEVVVTTNVGSGNPFRFEVTKICPSQVTLSGALNKQAKLGILYRFRNEVMRRSAVGRQYIRLFYQHALEASWLLLRHPDLRAQARDVLDKLLPKFEGAVDGHWALLSATDKAAIKNLLDAISVQASPRLQRTIRRLQSDLQRREPLSLFKIHVEAAR